MGSSTSRKGNSSGRAVGFAASAGKVVCVWFGRITVMLSLEGGSGGAYDRVEATGTRKSNMRE